jgi:hypothetical protein
LKPIGQREVSNELSMKLAATGIKQKAFYKWRKVFLEKVD